MNPKFTAQDLRAPRMVKVLGVEPRPLTQELLRSMLHYDAATGIFRWVDVSRRNVSVGARAGTIQEDGYRTISVYGRAYREHRLAWLYTYGCWPSDQIDHINRVRNDNRIVNLRDVDQCGNMQNAVAGPKSRTGVRGVAHHPLSGKFAAYISRNRKKRWLGLFLTVEEAAVARARAELEAQQ